MKVHFIPSAKGIFLPPISEAVISLKTFGRLPLLLLNTAVYTSFPVA